MRASMRDGAEERMGIGETDSSGTPVGGVVTWLITGFVLLAAVGVPLARWPGLEAAYGYSIGLHGMKLLTLATACLLGWAGLLVRWRNSSLPRIIATVLFDRVNRWTSLLMLGLLVSGAVASENLGVGWLGAEARMDGALAFALTLHAAQIAYVAVSRGLLVPERAIRIVLLGGATTSAWIILEVLAVEQVLPGFPLHLATGLPAGGIGHPGAATIYLGAMFCLGVGSLMVSRARARARAWSTPLATLVIAIAMSLVAGRAGVLSSLVVLAFAAIVALTMRRARSAGVALASIAVLLVLMWGASEISGVSGDRVARFAGVTQPDYSFSSRFITWEVGLRASFHRPWLGSGPGSFADLVWTYSSPQQERELYLGFLPRDLAERAVRNGRALLVLENGGIVALVNANYDKAHNYVVDLAIQIGWPLALMLMAWWGFALLTAWRLRSVEPGYGLALLAFLIGVQVWFHNVNVDPMLMLLVGVALGHATLPKPVPVPGRT